MGKRDSSDLEHGTKQQHPGPDVWGGAVGDSIGTAQAAILRFHQVAAGFQLPLAEQLLSRTSNSQLKTRPTLTNLTAVAHIIYHWYKFCGTDASLAVFTNIFALAGRV